ncbi:unnamed protein product [Symbiodinium sp. CCMP2592]|nr:unnamed protein product [Symbiodinium sp. CCMP2592]
MDKSKAAPVPLKWRRQVLPPAPPEDGRPEEPWREGNRSDADSEENVQFVTSRTPSSESEDFLRALPERPDDEYDDAPGRAQLVATLRELLEEEEQSETSQGAQKAETARLPTPPAAPAEDLQVNEEFALEEEFREEENIEHDVNVQLQLDDSLAISAVEDSQQPLQEPAEKRGRLGSALRARAKAFARGRASKTDGKGKKKNKAQAQSPPASLPRANSRLSEMSSASFVFDDDEEEISSESQLKRSFRCFSCRFQCSLSCISFQIYVLALALAVAGAIYMGLEGPEIQLGAFDLWTQVQKPGSQDARYFAFARRSALGLRHALPLGPANASAARQWHSIELFWEMGASEEQKLQDFQPEVISDAYMSRVHAAEAQVQALTGWSSFCNATPAEVQFLCRPGDSLPALAFGTWEAPNFNEQILGMKWKALELESPARSNPAQKQTSHRICTESQRAMRPLPLLAAFLAALVNANILTYDTLPVNSAGTWFGPMQAKYACSDPSTDAGLEECLSVLLAPNGYTTDYLKLVYEAPAITWNDENRTKFDLVRVNGSTVKVKVGESVPMMGGMDETVDGVAGSEYNGFLVATDFAYPWEPARSSLQMMLAQLIISNGFSARSMPLFTYTNDGAIDDDGCLGMVNNTPGFDATTLAEKCPDVKNLTSGMYKYTFIAYQESHLDCPNCTLTFRNRVEVGIFSTITINSDKTLDTIGSTAVSKIRFEDSSNSSMYLEIELPTVVTTGRKDSQKSDANGATVTVTKISDTSFYLDFAMAAPGPDNIAFYDPAVTGQGPPPSDTSVGSGFASSPCLWVLLSSLLWKVM